MFERLYGIEKSYFERTKREYSPKKNDRRRAFSNRDGLRDGLGRRVDGTKSSTNLGVNDSIAESVSKVGI